MISKQYQFEWIGRIVGRAMRPTVYTYVFFSFWLMTTLSNQKLKNAKYSFWLQKGVKNLIRENFLSRDLQIVGGFICYFWAMTILSTHKLKNAKYRFWW